MSLEDLREHKCQHGESVSVKFGAYRIHQHGPNSQGIIVLIVMSMLERFGVNAETSVDLLQHLQLECLKLAFRECRRDVTDSECMRVTVE